MDYCNFEVAMSINVISSSLHQCDVSCWAELPLDRVSMGEKAQTVSEASHLLPGSTSLVLTSPLHLKLFPNPPLQLGQEVLSLLGKQAVDLPVSSLHVALEQLSVMVPGFPHHTIGPRRVSHPWTQRLI